MSVISPARPDLAAHREATTAPFPKLVRELVAVIGKKLIAYIAGVKDVRAIDRWMDAGAPYKSAEERLRFAFRVVKTLENHERGSVVQSWLSGLNPELNDRVPIRLLREGDLEIVGTEILAAVRAFVAGRSAIPLSIESQGTIFRICRRPKPWQAPDWSLVGSDGTFGNRFDDPDGIYRVLYASSQRLGCYLVTAHDFLPPRMPGFSD